MLLQFTEKLKNSHNNKMSITPFVYKQKKQVMQLRLAKCQSVTVRYEYTMASALKQGSQP